MAIENVRKFEEKINEDEALQARFQELADAFDGDKQDEKALFDAVVAPLATEAGLPYTYDEALEYVTQRGDDEDLDADEAKAAAGGIIESGCIGFGMGMTANACSEEQLGANACYIIGIGGLWA